MHQSTKRGPMRAVFVQQGRQLRGTAVQHGGLHQHNDDFCQYGSFHARGKTGRRTVEQHVCQVRRGGTGSKDAGPGHAGRRAEAEAKTGGWMKTTIMMTLSQRLKSTSVGKHLPESNFRGCAKESTIPYPPHHEAHCNHQYLNGWHSCSCRASRALGAPMHSQ
jgi:hypothetical protein